MLITSSIPLLCVAVFVAGYGAYAFVPIAFTSIYKIKGISPQAVSIGMAMIFTTNGVGGALGGTLSASLAHPNFVSQTPLNSSTAYSGRFTSPSSFLQSGNFGLGSLTSQE